MSDLISELIAEIIGGCGAELRWVLAAVCLAVVRLRRVCDDGAGGGPLRGLSLLLCWMVGLGCVFDGSGVAPVRPETGGERQDAPTAVDLADALAERCELGRDAAAERATDLARELRVDQAKPDLAKPDLAKPDLAKPDLAKPDLAKPDLAKPDLAKPDLAKPDLAKPDLAKPDLPPGCLACAGCCQAGACVPLASQGPGQCGKNGALCQSCGDGNPCTTDSCQAGVCVSSPVASDVVCDDGKACTTGDSCQGGTCVGAPLDCSGLDTECTIGVCEEAKQGCVLKYRAEGTSCVNGSRTCCGGICCKKQTGCCITDTFGQPGCLVSCS